MTEKREMAGKKRRPGRVRGEEQMEDWKRKTIDKKKRPGLMIRDKRGIEDGNYYKEEN